MLSNYSWGQYLMIIITLIAVYYVCIMAFFYRKEISDILSGKIRFTRPGEQDDTTDAPFEEGEQYEELQSITGDLKRNILLRAGMEPNKEQLLLQLKNRLANYEGMGIPAFRISVNHFIQQEAKEICGVAYSEQELEAAWKALPH